MPDYILNTINGLNYILNTTNVLSSEINLPIY